MVIDCGRCAVRGLGCGECVVSVVFGAAPEGVELDDDVHRALGVLAAGGLVPHLQVVPRDVAVGQ